MLKPRIRSFFSSIEAIFKKGGKGAFLCKLEETQMRKKAREKVATVAGAKASEESP